MLKVLTVLGTRPEIIRLSRIIPVFDRHFEQLLVYTGQNYDYELSDIFFEQLSLRKPDIRLNCAASTPILTISRVLTEADRILRDSQPDALVVLGDTNSSYVALAAKRLKIPVFHLEAGNRSFDQRTPEEINRKVIDHISDINLTYSDFARENLLREGLRPEYVIKIGSPLKEVFNYYSSDIERSLILNMLGLEVNSYFVISVHREENVDSNNLHRLIALISFLSSAYSDKKIVLSLHPRTRSRLEKFSPIWDKNLLISKPFGLFDYLKLQTNSFAVLSDSGSLIEESSILGFNAVSLRESHERQEGAGKGVIFASFDVDRIQEALLLFGLTNRHDRPRHIINDYDVDNISDNLVRIVLSYVGYINTNIWKKAI